MIKFHDVEGGKFPDGSIKFKCLKLGKVWFVIWCEFPQGTSLKEQSYFSSFEYAVIIEVI